MWFQGPWKWKQQFPQDIHNDLPDCIVQKTAIFMLPDISPRIMSSISQVLRISFCWSAFCNVLLQYVCRWRMRAGGTCSVKLWNFWIRYVQFYFTSNNCSVARSTYCQQRTVTSWKVLSKSRGRKMKWQFWQLSRSTFIVQGNYADLSLTLSTQRNKKGREYKLIENGWRLLTLLFCYTLHFSNAANFWRIYIYIRESHVRSTSGCALSLEVFHLSCHWWRCNDSLLSVFSVGQCGPSSIQRIPAVLLEWLTVTQPILWLQVKLYSDLSNKIFQQVCRIAYKLFPSNKCEKVKTTTVMI
jgi:hypothetical protein